MAYEFGMGEKDKDGLTIGENLVTEWKEIQDLREEKFSLDGECYLHKDKKVWHYLWETASRGNKGMSRKTRD